MSARSRKTRLLRLPALVAALFSGAAAAAPVWLECAGHDQRFSEGKGAQHVIQVMFDEPGRSVLVKDSLFSNLQAEKVEITPAVIQGSGPAFRIGIDRSAGTFIYNRYTNSVNISLMSGTCKVAPAPQPQKF